MSSPEDIGAAARDAAQAYGDEQFAAGAASRQAEVDALKAQETADIATIAGLRTTLTDLQAAFDAYKASHPDNPTPSGLRFGTYMGHFAAATVEKTIGNLPHFSTYYYQAKGATPAPLDVAKHQAELDQGITQVIDLDYKGSTVSIAQVAKGDADTALTKWLDDLRILTDYAKAKNNGAQVWFSFVHEAIVHINQNKFTKAPKPTTAQMAAAWNRVMGLCRDQVPDAVRTYWFGGMENKVGGVAGGVAHGDQLDADLIQAVTFDPYRFASHSADETPEQTFGAVVDALKARPWAQGKPWGLTEYGTEAGHGDAANAAWITAAVDYLRAEGASIAVFFDRVNGVNDYVITGDSSPLSLAAYRAAVA